MEVKTQVATKIVLTTTDMRQALADYITANGCAMTADDLPDEVLKDSGTEFVVMSESVESTPVKVKSKSKSTKPVEVAKGPEPVQEHEKAHVPNADVEAYRTKLANEARAKAEAEAEAMKKSIKATEEVFQEAEVITKAEEVKAVEEVQAEPVKTRNIFDDEPSIVTSNSIVTHEDKLDDDDVVEQTPVVAKTTSSIFEDDTPVQTASATVTQNLFA